MNRFYRWRKRDFLSIPAYNLEQGDELAYSFGGNLNYETVTIEEVTKGNASRTVLVQDTLPVGAIAVSNGETCIAIFWRGKRPLIQVSQQISFYSHVLIRPKERMCME